MLALCVSVAGLATLLLTLAAPAQAASSPAPILPIKISVPALVPTTAPSHPLKLDVPGVTSVEVDLPDVPALLGSGKTASDTAPASDAPKPDPAAPTTKPVPTARREKAAAPVAAPTRPSSATPHRQAVRTRDVTVARVRNSDATIGSEHRHRPVAATTPKARAAIEAFRGMLRTDLPLWLLAGIVAACGAGTILVVRSGQRPASS